MIQLRPDFSVSSQGSSHLPALNAKGPLGHVHQMHYEADCYNATAKAGEQIENWITSLPRRIASYVWSKLPSFTLPGAYASKTCDETPQCKIPEGSYTERCTPPKVTLQDGECELTARCQTMYEGLPYQQSSIRFAPGDKISVENRNGTLVAISSRDPVVKAFKRIADDTGGRPILSPTPEDFTSAIEEASKKILEDSEGYESLDLAIVLDTTSSMGPYIKKVQENLVSYLNVLQTKKNTRVAVVEYRDNARGDSFLNRIDTDFTSNFVNAREAVRSITTDGGGDEPEAVLDALLVAKKQLSWNLKAKRVVLLVGDAPPHPKTKDGLHDESEVVAQYQTEGTKIAVYPVIAKRA